MYEDNERLTANVSVKADITKWWFIQYRLGVDSYLQESASRIAAGGVNKQIWQNGMMSDNSKRFQYLSHYLISNMSKQFGDFDFNLLLGAALDDTETDYNYKMAYNFSVPDFYSYANATTENKAFSHSALKKRLVGVFGEFGLPGRIRCT